MRKSSESGAVRFRTLVEIFLIFVFAYVLVQVGPAYVLRVNFLNELEIAANAPVEHTASDIRQNVLETAEGFGITLLSENVHVVRDRSRNKTIIEVAYDLHLNFWPRFTYVWTVRDRAEALLF